MNRREVVAGLALPLLLCRGTVALAQSRTWRVVRLGLTSFSPEMHNVFVSAMAELGYVEGMNLEMHARYANNDPQRLPALADEVVALKPDVIVASFEPAVRALKARTTTIPIVMTFVPEPVERGLIQSLHRPGANITGCRSELLTAAEASRTPE
jgi:putative tryptophan/tyrosine transport system substrate-binding protein